LETLKKDKRNNNPAGRVAVIVFVLFAGKIIRRVLKKYDGRYAAFF
jgi:hypothetical protein